MYRLLISLFLSPKLSLTTVGRHGITVYLCKRRWVYVCGAGAEPEPYTR
jgi:hypothetical protein